MRPKFNEQNRVALSFNVDLEVMLERPINRDLWIPSLYLIRNEGAAKSCMLNKTYPISNDYFVTIMPALSMWQNHLYRFGRIDGHVLTEHDAEEATRIFNDW